MADFVGWLGMHPEAVVAFLALLFSISTWIIRRRSHRKLINYRLHHDVPIEAHPDMEGMAELAVRLEGNDVANASMALLRVQNSGHAVITKADFVTPLSFEFPGRTVIAAKISEPEPSGLLREIANDPVSGRVTFSGSRVELPPMHLNRNDRFRLLVLLSGPQAANNVRDSLKAEYHLNDGRIEPDGTNRVRRLSSALLAMFIVVFVAAGGVFVGRSVTSPGPGSNGVQCASGTLTLFGSTAFAPVATAIGDRYRQYCHAVQIVPQVIGSNEGTTMLESNGSRDTSVSSAQLAMSDGGAPSGELGDLRGHTEAIVIFAVVVNKAVGKYSLSPADLARIYSGAVTNWSQLGGPNLDISLVSRGSESGTRNTFEQKILHGSEPAVSSNDCVHRDRDPNARVIRCERPTTDSLLQEVNNTPGAIGYAEVSATAKSPQVNRVQLDGRDADIETVKNNSYQFWTTEYLYSFRTPPPGSLAADFLDFMATSDAKNLLQTMGYIPCENDRQDLADLCTQR